MDMMTDEFTLNYYERITCSSQWRSFNRALAAELIESLPEEENRKLFARIGRRMAQDLPLARCDTLAQLQDAFNARWERIDWGFGTLGEAEDHVAIVHACSPMAMAFGSGTSGWTEGLLEGAYQTWFAAQGMPTLLGVRARSAGEEADADPRRVRLTLARTPA
jgi:hypothetical protein